MRAGIDTIRSGSPTPSDTPALTKRQMVVKAILDRCHAVSPKDLPLTESEMLPYFEAQKNGDYLSDFTSEDYYRLLDLRDMPDTKVVVVGDIHSDYTSLAALLLKLTVSDYDYFEKAYFVFLGDYLDRGTAVVEPLLLLMDLHRILGQRLIMLRGNHELIGYHEERQKMTGKVLSLNSVPYLNEYCADNKEFLRLFAYFYSTLPTYVYLKAGRQNILLTHASVPRQVFLDTFRFDTESGAIIFKEGPLAVEDKESEEMTGDEPSLNAGNASHLLDMRNKILSDMIWGDPSNCLEQDQERTRFLFGSLQFEAYAVKNNLSRVFRSHEPERYGFKAYYEQRLYTIFSTGGKYNKQTGYERVQPAFAVIRSDGSYFIENSYIYKKTDHGQTSGCVNLFTHGQIDGNEASHFSLNSEFFCSNDTATRIMSVLERVSQGFPQKEEEEPPADKWAMTVDFSKIIVGNSDTTKQPPKSSGADDEGQQ